MTAANILTLGRFACGPLVFASGWHRWWAICLAVYALGLATDAIDGRLARMTHTATPFGRAMDSAADKALVAAAILALGTSGRLSIWFVFLFIVREFAVFGLRAIRPPNGTTVAEISDKLGRFRFFILHIGVITLLLPTSSHWLVVSGFCTIALSTCLAYSGLVYYIVRDWPTLRITMRKAS
jgi:CDP-diacylglycerol--glycerol-3-phosphate 3-phosphatidyltransferase